MSGARQPALWRVVAAREVSTKLRDRGFLIGAGFTLVLLVGLFVIGGLVGGGSDDHDVAVTGGRDAALVGAAEEALRASGSPDATITTVGTGSRAAAERAVRAGDADAALLPTDDGYEVVGDDGLDAALLASLRSAVQQRALQVNATEQGVDLQALARGSTVTQRLLDPDAEQSSARSVVAFAFAFVFYLTALTFGMTIAQSVTREKESRVVEILAAAIPVRALLWGKIAGNTVLALGQVVLLAAVGVAGLLVTGRTDLLAGIGPAVLWYVAFFVLGFLALAALWSVAGSLASRQEDLGSTTLPMQMLLLAPYLVSVAASDQVRTVVSVLPIASTMLMPGRMAEGSVPWWQVGLGIALTVLAAAVFVRIGSTVYERTLLRTGGKIGYGAALRMARTGD